MSSIISLPLPVTLINGITADGGQVQTDLNYIATAVNANAAGNGVNSDITSLTALTSIPSNLTAVGTTITNGTFNNSAIVGCTIDPTTTAITQPLGTNTNQIATMAAIANQAFQTVLPAQPGNPYKDFIYSLSGIIHYGPAGLSGYSAKTSAYTLVESDKEKLIDITAGTFTLSFTAANLLGVGWGCYVRNRGTGEITIPSSDGLTNWKMYSGEARLFVSDGTNFYSLVVNPLLLTATSSLTFIVPPGYNGFDVEVWAAGGGGGSGRRGAVASARTGGAGGGGGAYKKKLVFASALSPSVAVTVGSGGVGGAAITTNDTDGNVGLVGSNSSFGSFVISYGGGPGQGGKNVSSIGGGGGGSLSVGNTSGQGGFPYDGQGSIEGSRGFGGAGAPGSVASYSSGFGGGNGGASSESVAAPGGSSAYGSAGGGAGGSISAADALNNPAAGGSQASDMGGGAAGGISNASAPTAGATGTTFLGGGGGGAATTAPASAGGVGGIGAGGGGGGASLNGVNSGAGGNGGAGIVRILGIA